MPVIKHDPAHKSVDQTVVKFNTTALQTANDAKSEHGSRQFASAPKFDKNAVDYGRPLVGTKSQARGVRGGEHVMREVIFLCEMIEQNGEGTPPDCFIKFGPLFYMYSRISETLVGMLIRARKYGLIDFEGEMLYQRQDDHKKIRLLMSSKEINNSIEYTGDPVNIIKFNNGKMPPVPPPRIKLASDAPPAPVFSLGPPTKKAQATVVSGNEEPPKAVPTNSATPNVAPSNPATPKAMPINSTTTKAIPANSTTPKTTPTNSKTSKAVPTTDLTMPNERTVPINSTLTKTMTANPTMPKAVPKTVSTNLATPKALEKKNDTAISATTKANNKMPAAPPMFCLSFSAK